MRKIWLLLYLLLAPGVACAAQGWVLEPAVLAPGGVARLIWKGDPTVRSEVRFKGETLQLMASSDGPMTLLGVDLEQPEGAYPIQATVSDRQGRLVHYGLFLRVERPPRGKSQPSERLTLRQEYVTPRAPEQLERIRRERALLKGLYAGRSVPLPWQPFRRPLSTPVSSIFGRARIMNGNTPSLHAGVDFSGAAGTPVTAGGDGRVIYAGDLYFTGLTVILDHGDGLFTFYAHLQRILCQEGASVVAGAIVGELGSTGRATGPHLHWGARLRGERVDPLALVSLSGREKR